MARKTRIDDPGALHLVIGRGTAPKWIYLDDASGYKLDRLIERGAQLLRMFSEELIGPGKARQRVEDRSLTSYWATTE